MLEFDPIKAVYLHGHKHPELISPDNWNMDSRFRERPNARRIQMDLFYDYRTNVNLYPQWQSSLREREPQTLIFWGQNDIFFTREGGEAYLRDCRTQRCTDLTPVILRWRTAWKKSPQTSNASIRRK